MLIFLLSCICICFCEFVLAQSECGSGACELIDAANQLSQDCTDAIDGDVFHYSVSSCAGDTFSWIFSVAGSTIDSGAGDIDSSYTLTESGTVNLLLQCDNAVTTCQLSYGLSYDLETSSSVCLIKNLGYSKYEVSAAYWIRDHVLPESVSAWYYDLSKTMMPFMRDDEIIPIFVRFLTRVSVLGTIAGLCLVLHRFTD